jgi:hypothetical protein
LRLICPACHRLHELRALDGRVIDLGELPQEPEKNSN